MLSLKIFTPLPWNDLFPDSLWFSCALHSCCSINDHLRGRQGEKEQHWQYSVYGVYSSYRARGAASLLHLLNYLNPASCWTFVMRRLRWDYRDNVSRWREAEAPSGLSTPNGLKDFNRATDNRTDAAFTMLKTPSWAGIAPGCPRLARKWKRVVCQRDTVNSKVMEMYFIPLFPFSPPITHIKGSAFESVFKPIYWGIIHTDPPDNNKKTQTVH